jgi:ankyrin repeat protein
MPTSANVIDNEEVLIGLIKETINHGANINAQNTRGDSVLHNAVYVFNVFLLMILLILNVSQSEGQFQGRQIPSRKPCRREPS